MNIKKIVKPKTFLFLVAFLVFLVVLLSYFFKITPKPENGILVGDPSFSMFTRLSVNDVSKSKFIKNYNLPVAAGGRTSINFYVAKDDTTNVPLEVKKQFADLGWNTTKEWGYEAPFAYSTAGWEQGSKKATVVLFEDLDSVGIEGFKNNYDVEGLAPKNTLFAVFISS